VLANSLVVSGQGGRVGAYGLELRLDDPALTTPSATWVGIGPEKGLQAEIALLGRFWVDPGALSTDSPGRLAFLYLRPALDPGAESVRLFLQRRGEAWHLGAEAWDDAAQGWVDAGSGRLAAGSPPADGAYVEFEWGAASSVTGSDGYLRVYRLRDGQPEERVAVFTAERLRNGAQRINHLQVGIVEPAAQPPGTAGLLYLDEVALYRGPEPAARPAEEVTPDTSGPSGPPPHASAPPSTRKGRSSAASPTEADEAGQPDVGSSPGGVQAGPQGPDPDKRDERRAPKQDPRTKIPRER